MDDVIISIVSVTAIIFLLLIGIAFSFFRVQKQRTQQQEELAATRLNYEKELRKVETEEREAVLHQLAQDLHDNIGQLLMAMHIQIQTQKTTHPETAEGYQPIEIYLGEVTQQLRLLSKTLNTDSILQNGLDGAVLLQIERLKALKRFTVESTIQYSGSPFEKDAELMVFRVFQEIIQNILKHTKPTLVTITLTSSEEQFLLEVKDDGPGFDYATLLTTNKASGVRNILKRSELVGLNCEFITEPGKGTSVILKK